MRKCHLLFSILILFLGMSVPCTLQAQTPTGASSAPQAWDAPPIITWPACVTGQTVLLIEDSAPWYSGTDATVLGADAAELTAQNKQWCGINSSALAGTDLTPFKEIIIPSDQPQAFYTNLFPGGAINSALANWVSAGGILSANLADCGWQASNWSSASPCEDTTAANSYTFVGGLTHVQEYDETNNIVASTDPVIADGLPCPSGNCALVVNTGPYTDLDDWDWSSHGYFAAPLPAGSTTILTDSLGNAVFIEYPYGSGKVIATLNTVEWMYDGATSAGSASEIADKKLLANEIAYQAVYTTPPQQVPLSSTGGTLTASYPSVIPSLVTTFPPGVIYNDASDVATAYIAVNFQRWNPTTFNTNRLTGAAANTWSGGTTVPLGTVCTGISGDCIVIEYLCYDSSYNPIVPCNVAAPPTCEVITDATCITITPSYTPSSPQPNPMLGIADDGANNWANITLADPTGGTKKLNTDVFIGDLPPTISITAPAANSVYALNYVVPAVYSCTNLLPPPLPAPTCTSNALPSGNIDTSTVGSHTFTVTSTDAAGATGTASVTYQVLPAPTVSFTGAPASAAYQSTFTVTATTNASTAAVITASGPCTVTGTTVTMTSGTGTCILTANWAADSNYSAATLTQSTNAATIAPTVTFTGAPASAAYQSTFTVTATTNASTTAVITPSGPCSIAGTTVTMTSGTGTCTLTANWAADSNYSAASLTQSTNAATIAATAKFGGAPASAAYQSTFTVTATTNASTAAVITASGPCTVTGTTVTMTSGTGTCILTANWAADSSYSAATLTQSTNAAKIASTVTFTGAPTSAVYNSTFTVKATTNASTTAAIAASGACSVSGTTVTMTSGTGICSLTASWAADSNYMAATAAQSTAALKAGSTTTIASSPNPSAPGQAVLVSFTVTGNGSPTGSVTVSASTGEPCLPTPTNLSAGAGSCSLTFFTDGSRTLTASYSGDPNFNNSTSAAVTQSVIGPLASLSPASVIFGNVYLGLAAVQTVTLTNTGNAPMSVGKVKVSGGNDPDDFIPVSLCPSTLAASKACQIIITFTADSDNYGPTGVLSVADNAYNSPQTVALSGTVINPLASFSTTSLSFGTQKVGTSSAAKAVTLKNRGTTALSITSIAIAGTNPGDFTEVNNCPLAAPWLAPAASCTINVTFTPTAKGSRSGKVVITDNALLSPQVISLSGTGN
jgi:hypothetical protein